MGARAVSLRGLFRLVLCRGAALGASQPGAGRLSLLTDARPRPSVTSRVPHCPSLPTTCCRGRGKSLERKEHRGGGSRGRPCRLRARPPWGRSPAVFLLHSLLVTRQETETEVPAVVPSSQNKISKPKQTSGSEPEAAPLRPAGRGSPASFRWGSTASDLRPLRQRKEHVVWIGRRCDRRGVASPGGGKFSRGLELQQREARDEGAGHPALEAGTGGSPLRPAGRVRLEPGSPCRESWAPLSEREAPLAGSARGPLGGRGGAEGRS